MIKTIYSFVVFIISLLFVTPFGITGFVLGVLGLRKPMTVWMYWIARDWGRFMLAMVGCKLTVMGRENIPVKGSVCFVSNHNGIVDILPLLKCIGRPFGFVAKKELILLPILNMWIPLLGGLYIDRKNPRKAFKTINTGIARIKSGGAMIIFPEGHRSKGRGLLPFHPGSLKLATQSGAVIVPVAISGTYDVFEKTYRVNACPLRITFCKPINTADIPLADRKQALSDQIYGVIKEALETNGE
ncbi:MAG: 1-acyl-sn-glycerol-3-phosphate acyltransferase [Treponema sp.]|nr:1-acyl-sn-glycerol-3-phosphate acyltransferase [Treponema sp.]